MSFLERVEFERASRTLGRKARGFRRGIIQLGPTAQFVETTRRPKEFSAGLATKKGEGKKFNE